MYEETKLYENLTYNLHTARSYRVNYSAENIRNDVRQIIIIIYENSYSTHECGAHSCSPQLLYHLNNSLTTQMEEKHKP